MQVPSAPEYYSSTARLSKAALPSCNEMNTAVLLDFKASFTNGHKLLASWNNSQPCGGPHLWEGVNCAGAPNNTMPNDM